MKIVLNKSFGGFCVSKEGYELYAKKLNKEIYVYRYYGNNLYKKANEIDGFCFTMCFTKDFGEVAKISDEDYEKYHIFLDREHRQDEILIEVVEELKDKASGRYGDLRIVEIPDNYFYKIDEYDGMETLYYSASEILMDEE